MTTPASRNQERRSSVALPEQPSGCDQPSKNGSARMTPAKPLQWISIAVGAPAR
ncbi:hypothetical protein [Ralstonia syzygii]|uniref:hypothetical protein n=1 Tax=Ralstonia syzygii TaxID=28097 RepID=UPI001FFB2357